MTKYWTAVLLLSLLYHSPASAFFSFFGFGAKPSESTEDFEDTVGAASSQNAAIAFPNSASSSTTSAPTSFTSYLFGTGFSGTQSSSQDVRPMGGALSSQWPMGLGSAPTTGGVPSIAPTTANWGNNGGNSPPRAPPPRAPLLPPIPPTNHHHNAQTQTKGQDHRHPSPTLSQSNSPRLPLHRPNFQPTLATTPPRMPAVNTRNPQPHLTSNHAPQHQNPQGHAPHQHQNPQGQAPHQMQTNNRFRVNGFKQAQDNKFGPNNDGFGNNGKAKTGTFSWTSPEGEVYAVKYVADPMQRPSEGGGSMSVQGQNLGQGHGSVQTPPQMTPYVSIMAKKGHSESEETSTSPSYAYSSFKRVNS